MRLLHLHQRQRRTGVATMALSLCLLVGVSALHGESGRGTGDSGAAIAAVFLGVGLADVRPVVLPPTAPGAPSGGTRYTLTSPAIHGLAGADVRLSEDLSYVATAFWTYPSPHGPGHGVSRSRGDGVAFLRKRCPFYSAKQPLTSDVIGPPDGREVRLRQTAPSRSGSVYVTLVVDLLGRPRRYKAVRVPPEPARTAEVRLSEEQALAAARRGLAGSHIVAESVRVLALTTNSYYAPVGQPMYLVGVEGILADPKYRRPPSISELWAVNATTGQLVKRHARPTPSPPTR